jgi:deoxyribonuclease V
MDLEAEIADLVGQIPPGRVATFADVAGGLGDARAAMAVFRILRESPVAGLHRVVRASAHLAFTGSAGPLRREGVRVTKGRVDDLDRLRWREFCGPRTLARLREEQIRLAARVDPTDRDTNPDRIAAFDVSYDRDTAFAAGVVMDAAGETVLEEVAIETPVTFPYVPGYLAYREFPAIEACFRRLQVVPDLLMIDGHGVLHPARFGIASFAGVVLDRPSIGVAKSLLVGTPGPTPREAGGSTDVRIDGEILGAGLRSGRSRRLVYVSVGHGISLSTALRITKRLCKSRIPEPLRRADLRSKNKKRKWRKKRIEF